MKSLDAHLLLQTWFADEEVKPLKKQTKAKGGKKRDSMYDNHKFDTSVCNSDKGKGKAVDDGSSGKGKNIDMSKMVVEKLDNMEKHSDGFFVDCYQGEGDSLCGLFWADKVARLNYKRFDDVISFNATFRSNK
nr:protein FAR1-related sequence 5-like [Tanacetum cinerariifolium]